jgi:Protein of unknown function (DUF1091)
MVSSDQSKILISHLKDFSQVSAYLDIILDRIECSSDSDFIECSTLKVKRVKKQRLMFGNVTILQPLDNDVNIQVLFFKKQGGEYRKMPYKIVKPLCDAIKEDIYFYDELCANSTLPGNRPCPYPAGFYIFNGYNPSLANIPNSIIPSGEYRFHFWFKKGSKEIFLSVTTLSVIQL